MYKTNWEIGHDMKLMLEAHKGPVFVVILLKDLLLIININIFCFCPKLKTFIFIKIIM